MCFIINTIITGQKFTANPFQLSSEYVLKQEFHLKYAYYKNTLILLKKS